MQTGVRDVSRKEKDDAPTNGFYTYTLRVVGKQNLDRDALTHDLRARSRFLHLLSLRRADDSPAVDLRHSASVVRRNKKRKLGADDVKFLLANSRHAQRNLRVVQVMAQIRDLYRLGSKRPATLAGSQDLLKMLPVIEAHLDLYSAIGLPVERTRLTSDAEIHGSAAAAVKAIRDFRRARLAQNQKTQNRLRELREIKDKLPSDWKAIDDFGRAQLAQNQKTQNRLQEIKDKLPWAVAYQESVAFDYYRQALERVISRSEAALQGSGQRARSERTVEQYRALLRTATGLRQLLGQ